MKKFSLLLIIILFPIQVSAASLKCVPFALYILDAKGVNQSEVGPNYTILDIAKKKLKRCDNQGCDSYNITSKRSGAYMNIQTTIPSGYMMKMVGKAYMEAATIGMVTLMYYGLCE